MIVVCRIRNTLRKVPVDLMFRLYMFSIVIVDVTISCRSFVSGQSRTKVSAGFTDVSGLAIAALILYTAPCLTSGLSLSLTVVSSRRKMVISLCAFCILYGCSIRAILSEVPLMNGTVAVETGPKLTLVWVLESALLWVFRLTKSAL